LVNNLTVELEILRELYFDERIYKVSMGIYPDSAAEDAFELKKRENKVYDIIERHAMSIGL
jgi:hypothetical protein